MFVASTKTITIPQAEYDHLIDDSEFLECLRVAGVDNWEGYSDAQEEYNSTHKIDDEEKEVGD